MRNQNIPLGYRIENGVVLVDQEEAEKVKAIFNGYLSGLSFAKAAEAAGLKMFHASVRNLVQNKKYLGDGFYPQIIEKEIFDKVEIERSSRELATGKVGKNRRTSTARIATCFSVPKVQAKFKDPFKQAEYAYSKITEEV